MMGSLRALQTFIYTRKFFRTQKKDSLISIAMAVVILLLVLLITRKNMFESFSKTQSGFFSIVSACIWIGIFNSIQLICREKNDIVKDELDKGLHASSYIGAHFIYQFFLSLLQTIIILMLCCMLVGEFKDHFAQYFITILLIIFSSDMLALIISAVVPTPIVAMTVMPLVLILQLVMAGVIFELEGVSKIIAYITISRWGMGAMGAIADLNSLPNPLFRPDESGYGVVPVDYAKPAYEATAGNLAMCWIVLIIFILLSFFVSIYALKMTTRRLKK